jgi:hypothetical protein
MPALVAASPARDRQKIVWTVHQGKPNPITAAGIALTTQFKVMFSSQSTVFHADAPTFR